MIVWNKILTNGKKTTPHVMGLSASETARLTNGEHLHLRCWCCDKPYVATNNFTAKEELTVLDLAWINQKEMKH